MKKSIETDKQIIKKIIDYILNIQDSFNDFGVNSAQDLKNSKYAKYINTQLITNIHELKSHLQDDTLSKLKLFNNVRLKILRNIASHDYDSIDYDILYARCKQLIDIRVIEELKGVFIND